MGNFTHIMEKVFSKSERYKEKIFRIELIYLAIIYLAKGLRAEEITNLPDIPVHFQF